MAGAKEDLDHNVRKKKKKLLGRKSEIASWWDNKASLNEQTHALRSSRSRVTLP